MVISLNITLRISSEWSLQAWEARGPRCWAMFSHTVNPLGHSCVWMCISCQWIREFLDKAEGLGHAKTHSNISWCEPCFTTWLCDQTMTSAFYSLLALECQASIQHLQLFGEDPAAFLVFRVTCWAMQTMLPCTSKLPITMQSLIQETEYNWNVTEILINFLQNFCLTFKVSYWYSQPSFKFWV